MSLEQTIMRAHKNPLSRQPAKRARDGEGRAAVYMDSYVRVDFGARTANKATGQREGR